MLYVLCIRGAVSSSEASNLLDWRMEVHCEEKCCPWCWNKLHDQL